MSTRSRIGIEMPDGKIKSIYCHWDGYPSGVGVKLYRWYKDRKKIEKLMELGDISSLGEDYDEELSKADWKMFEELDKKKREELLEKVSKMTVAYKDRGEDVPARIDDDETRFIQKSNLCGEEYVYLWMEDYTGVERWHVMETPRFKPLEDVLEESEEYANTERNMGIGIISQLDLGKDGATLEFN